MISKSFLSGIFSVVSFMLITTFAIPSTFAQCPPDVSGTWVVKLVETQECNPNPSDNGQHKKKLSFHITQEGDEISASFVDPEDGSPAALTGVVNGNSVYFKVENTEEDSPGCLWVTHCVGIIKGNRIRFFGTGGNPGNICDTDRWHAEGNIKIVK